MQMFNSILKEKCSDSIGNWLDYVDMNSNKFKNSGMNSRCYMSIYGSVFKKLNLNIPITSKLFEIYSLLEGQTSEVFIFPRQLFIKNGYLLGYFMDYVDAPTLFNLPLSTSIVNILKSISLVKTEIRKLSDFHINFRDIHSRDIYFKEKFNIGDIDAFFVSMTESSDNLYNNNLRKVYHGIIAGIFKGVISEYLNLVLNDEELKKYYDSFVVGDGIPLEFDLYINEMCNKIGIDVLTATIEDLRNGLKELTADISKISRIA